MWKCAAWLGLLHRARVNFGTECPKITQPCQVTLSDVTTLPEVSISVYEAGPPFRTLKTFDCFFGFLHECGSVQRGWGCSIGQGLILGRSVPKLHNLAK